MLRRTILSALLLAALAFADATGSWTAAIDSPIGTQNYTYTLKIDGAKLTGRAKSQFSDTEIVQGTVKGDEITFVENMSLEGMELKITYKGKVVGDEIKFTRDVAGLAMEEFTAKRTK
jgi:hypothetical protein